MKPQHRESFSPVFPILAGLRSRRDTTIRLQTRESRREMAIRARQIGWNDGLRDRHSGSTEFFRLTTATEINSWLEGWRSAQAVLKAEQAEIAALTVELAEL